MTSSSAFAIEVKTTLNNALNNADKISLIIEIMYNPTIEEINYLESDIKKDKVINIKDYVVEHQSILTNKDFDKEQFDIETEDYVDYSISNEKGFIIERISYTFQVFEILDLYIKPLKISYKIGNQNRIIYTVPIPVLSKQINIITDEKGKAILKHLKGPFYIESEVNSIVIVVLILVLIIIVVILLFLIKTKLNLTKTIAIKTPYEIAIDELDKLKKTDYTRKNKVKDFYIRLSEIIRRFLSSRLNLYIMESTTAKAEELLEKSLINKNLISTIIVLLEECDFVKFAKHKPKISEMNEDLKTTYDIVLSVEKNLNFDKYDKIEIEEKNV